MKKTAIYIIIFVSLFSTAWSMIINNNINDIKKELKQIKKEQLGLDVEIRLQEAELAYIINPNNLKNLNSSYLNLIPKPLVDAKNLYYQYDKSLRITKSKILLKKEIN